MNTEVIVALLGLLGVLTTGFFAYTRGKRSSSVEEFVAIKEAYEGLMEALRQDNDDLREEVRVLKIQLAEAQGN